MMIDFKIHNTNHLIKCLLGNSEYLINHLGLNKQELLVINYHGTPKKFAKNFNRQIEFFIKEFNIISPSQLKSFYSGTLTSEKPLLLLTFDDGIKNNLAAVEILNKHSIKACFFIVPEFIETPPEKQKEYFIKHIRPIINPYTDNETEGFEAMNWEELKTLSDSGHYIGSHTLTHKLIASQSLLENSILEIAYSKEIISRKLSSAKVDFFCSINNTLESISNKEMKLIREHYKYHFTTIPGPNVKDSSPYYIKRANIESHWLLGSVKYALGKWDLKRWKKADSSYLTVLKS